MRRAITTALALISIGAAVETAAAQETAPLTLREAVSIALRESPAIGAARAGEQIAAAQASQARATWIPEVSLRESWTRGNNPVFVFGSLLEQGRFGAPNFDPAFLNAPPSLTNWRQAISIRYPLFDQFRRLTGMAVANSEVSRSGLASDAARQDIRLRTMRAYFGLGLARERAAVAADAVKSAEAGVSSIRARVETGMVPQSELLAAEVQLADFRQEKIAADGEVAIAAAALNQMLRRTLTDAPAIATPLPDKPMAEPSLDEALQRGRSARPELKRAHLATDIAGLQFRSAQGSLLPRVDAFVDAGASGATFSQHDSDHTAGVTLSWNVLDPGRFGRVAQARAAADAARDNATSAADQVDLEIVSAFHRYRAAREKLEVGQLSVDHAQSAARMVHDRYEQGLTAITEDLRAQTALLAARMSLLAARYDTTIGYAELLRAIGGLNDVEPF